MLFIYKDNDSETATILEKLYPDGLEKNYMREKVSGKNFTVIWFRRGLNNRKRSYEPRKGRSKKAHLFSVGCPVHTRHIFRFYGLNWDNGQFLHPDERFLVQVADSIHFSGFDFALVQCRGILF